MGKKTISFDLSEDSISKAISELNQYKTEIANKTILFQQRVAERLKVLAQEGFTGAVVDEYTRLGDGSMQKMSEEAKVVVTVTHTGNLSVVLANGEDAVWIEFGTGVYYNPSNHPNAAYTDPMMLIGTFGEGGGAKKSWYFKDGEGVRSITHGIRKKMPMYYAVTAVCMEMSAIAKEVFG